MSDGNPEAVADKKLTLKQRKWLRIYLETGNATEAARQAYDCRSDESAWRVGSENVSKLKEPIESLMDQMGISDVRLLVTLRDGLEATKPIGALVLANTETGVLKTKENEGQIEVADYGVRHKYLETALKLKKRLGPEAPPPGPQQNNFFFGDQQIDRIIEG